MKKEINKLTYKGGLIMKKLETKCGIIYMDDYWTSDLDQDIYVCFYDSNKKFLDNFTRDIFTNEITQKFDINEYNKIISNILNCSSVEELLQYFNLTYMLVTKDLKEAYNFAIEERYLDFYYDEKLIDTSNEKDLLANEWINKIANSYIILAAY